MGFATEFNPLTCVYPSGMTLNNNNINYYIIFYVINGFIFNQLKLCGGIKLKKINKKLFLLMFILLYSDN